MRDLIFIGLLLATLSPAYAQGEQKVSPEVQALSATVLDLTGQNVTLRAQVIQANQKISDLQKQIEAQASASRAPEKGTDTGQH